MNSKLWITVGATLCGLVAGKAEALGLDCRWQEKTSYERGYWRPADFYIEIQNGWAKVREQTYFTRTYKPCWNDSTRDCEIDFGILPREYFKITTDTENALVLQQSGIGLPVELRFVFNGDFRSKGRRAFLAQLYGFGGNVRWVDGDEFLCRYR